MRQVSVGRTLSEGLLKRPDAQAAFYSGINAYEKGNFQVASQALSKSFALEPNIDTLFVWAQAERKLKHCDKAIDLYKLLLTSNNLPGAKRMTIEEKLAECLAIVGQ